MNSSIKNKSGKSGVKKFMFDTHDFDKKPEPEITLPEPPPPPPSFSEEQLMLAKEQAFQQGKAEGIAETRAAQEEKLAVLLDKLGQKVAVLTADEDRRALESSAAAITLSLDVVKKLLPRFSADAALNEAAAMISESLESRKDEPRITIIVPPQHIDALKARIDAIAQEKSYAGRLDIQADAALDDYDCRIEWADGGAERIFDRLFADIEAEFVKTVDSIMTTAGKITAEKKTDPAAATPPATTEDPETTA